MAALGLQRFNNHIDPRNQLSDPKILWKDISHGYILKLIFSYSFDGLWRPSRTFKQLPLFETNWRWQKWIHPLKKTEMTNRMCSCKKNHLEAVFEAAFGLWRPPIWTMSHLLNRKVSPNCGLLANEWDWYLKKAPTQVSYILMIYKILQVLSHSVLCKFGLVRLTMLGEWMLQLGRLGAPVLQEFCVFLVTIFWRN